MPRTVTDLVIRDVPLLRREQNVREAVEQVLAAELPALPVVDEKEKFAGIFGEREFMQALFPGYVGTLSGAGFVNRSLEDVIEKRGACASETVGQHMNDEHVSVDDDFSDVQVAEVFLHHRVLIVPVVSGGRVSGVITRSDFFSTLAERFLSGGGQSS
jgi:CBS-domain-containing membrane protein